MLKEIAVERYAFECAHCHRSWTADYDVQYIIAHESLWSFYRRNGVAVENPTAEQQFCPGCGRTTVSCRLVARRDIPMADIASDEPRQKVTSKQEEGRRAAPPLPTERLTTPGAADKQDPKNKMARPM